MSRIPPILLLLLLALGLRLGVTALRGFSRPPVLDQWSYAEIAKNVAAGRGIHCEIERIVGGKPVTRRLTSLRPPLYPLLLGGVYAMLGESVPAGRILNCLIGALSVVVFYGWARTLFSDRVAFLAALALAVWPSHLWASGELLTEPLFVLLVLALFTDLVRERPIRAGIWLGLAVLTRPVGLLLAVPAGLFLLTGPKRRILWFALPVLLLTAPWVIRNAAIHGRPLLTTNMGVTFYGGNSDLCLSADVPGRWHLPERICPANPPPLGYYGWPELSEEGNDRRFFSMGLAWVEAHPDRWARLAGFKVWRFFDPDPKSKRDDRLLKAWAGWLSFAPLVVLAVLGLWPVVRRGRAAILPVGLIGAQLLVALVFYGGARVRLPAVPAFLVLGAAGCVWLAGLSRRGTPDASRGPGGA